MQRVVTFLSSLRWALVSKMVQPPRSRPGCHQTYSFLPPRQTSPVISSIEQPAHNLSPGLPVTTAGCLRAPGRFLLGPTPVRIVAGFLISPLQPLSALRATPHSPSACQSLGHIVWDIYMHSTICGLPRSYSDPLHS